MLSFPFKAQGTIDLILCNGSINCCSRLCVPRNILVNVWCCIYFIETITFRLFLWLICFSFNSLIVHYAPGLIALRARLMRVFIILGNTLISSYLGWRCCLCILQPPTVSRSGFVGTEVLLVGRESGSAGPQSTTERDVRFCGPRDPEGSVGSWKDSRIDRNNLGKGRKWCSFLEFETLSIVGNKRPTRSNRLFFYCKTYFSINMFRAPLCPSSGAQYL